MSMDTPFVELKIRPKPKAHPKTKIISKTDEAWKEALKSHFKDFMELCWLEAYQDINWQSGYEFLEQELLAISHNDEIGKRVTDKLIKVWRKNGNETWVLVHIEVESSPRSEHLSERMFVYRNRIYERYRRDIASLAILVDSNANWRPNIYERALWGTSVKLQYPLLKIIDFKSRKEALEKCNNPFAVIILIQLAAIETHGKQPARVISRSDLTRRLFRHGWSHDQIRSICYFMGGVLVLSGEYSLQYREEVEKIQKEFNVSYITDFEQWALEDGLKQGKKMGIEEGLQKGVQKGAGNVLVSLLTCKFQNIPEVYLTKIHKASSEQLLVWSKKILNAQTVEEIFV